MATIAAGAHRLARAVHEAAPTKDARSRAVVAIIDTIGRGLAGSRQPLAQRLAQAIAPAPGAAAILGGKARAGALDAAFMNAVAAQAFQADEGAVVPSGHCAVPLVAALLALGEDKHSTGAAFVESVAVGLSITSSLSADADIRDGGANAFHPCVVAVATAGACARMLGLDEKQTANALILTASQHAAESARAEPLLAGATARSGLLGALLAAQNVQGSADLPEALAKIGADGLSDPHSEGDISPGSMFDQFEARAEHSLPPGTVAILFERLETIGSAPDLADVGRLMMMPGSRSGSTEEFSRVDLAVSDHLVETQWVP